MNLKSIRTKLGTVRWFWGALAVYVGNQALIAIHLGSIREDLAKLQFTYSLEGFKAITSTWTSAEWQALQNHYIPDTIHPFIYGVLMLSALSTFANLNGLTDKFNKLLVLGVLAPVLDLAENLIFGLIAYNQMAASDGAIFTAGIISTVKWSVAGLVLLTSVVLFMRYQLVTKELLGTELKNKDYSFWMFLLISIGSAIAGLVYLFSPKIMPYHEIFLGTSFYDQPIQAQRLLLVFLKSAGFYAFINGIVGFFLIKRFYVSFEKHTWQMLFVVALLPTAFVFGVTLYVGWFTPWWAAGAGFVLAAIALVRAKTLALV